MLHDIWFWLFGAMTLVAVAQAVLIVKYDGLVCEALGLAERLQRVATAVKAG